MKNIFESQAEKAPSTSANSEPMTLANRRAFLATATAGATALAAPGLLSEPSLGAQTKEHAGGANLTDCLSTTSELVAFVRQAEAKLRGKKLAPGEELEPLLEKEGAKIPDFLRGSGITYASHSEESAKAGPNSLSIVMAGDPAAVDIRVFCICSRKWGVCVCLECGWIWCRIVIYGRF